MALTTDSVHQPPRHGPDVDEDGFAPGEKERREQAEKDAKGGKIDGHGASTDALTYAVGELQKAFGGITSDNGQLYPTKDQLDNLKDAADAVNDAISEAKPQKVEAVKNTDQQDKNEPAKTTAQKP